MGMDIQANNLSIADTVCKSNITTPDDDASTNQDAIVSAESSSYKFAHDSCTIAYTEPKSISKPN